MKYDWQHQVSVSMGRDRVIGRRNFVRAISTAGAAAGTLSWTDIMSASAADRRRRGKACILLWMQGGPSQYETFSPKPDHADGGSTKAISTSVPGIEVSENLPHVAEVMDQLAIIRSMTSKEGSHPRASFLLHTGYLPTASVKYPTLGSIVAHQIGDLESALPSFVRIGGRGRGESGAGLLGVQFGPFVLQAADRPPVNSRPVTGTPRYRRRLELLSRLESRSGAEDPIQELIDHQTLYEKASKMILSSQMKAFDLNQETDAMRDDYGRTRFGSGCLLARRLVESGVPFVEVVSSGWDTHADNFTRTRQLCEGIDRPMAQLIVDLKQRGLLEQTLIIWMGEFGRTPRINPRDGRDHYPRAFNVALAGGGVSGGRVVGQTDQSGRAVIDRPVSVQDLFQTFCTSLEIDAEHENMSPIGRPIRIVDGGAPVTELFD